MSARRIHPLAHVEPGADVGPDVEIGPFCLVASGARLGKGTKLLSHVTIGPFTTLGAENVVHTGSVLGGTPQDRTYQGEATTLAIGDRNVIREYVTINRGTVKGGGATVVGSRNLLMASCHVGHDCRVGNDITLANAVLLAGHVQVMDRAILAGAVAVHHFSRIGRMAYVGGMSRVVHDVPPFTKVSGERVRVRALNVVGLDRAGVPEDEIEELKEIFHVLFRRTRSFAEVLAGLKPPRSDLAAELVQFVREWSSAPAGRYLEQFRTDRPRVATEAAAEMKQPHS